MRRAKLNMKLMIIIFFFSLCMILILELQSMYIVRSWIVSIIPILNGRREFFSNFFMGMFSTGLIGVPTAFLDYYYEREDFLNEMRCTFGTFKNRIENIGDETIDEIKQLFYDGTVAKFEKIVIDYKKIIFHRKFYSKKAMNMIKKDEFKSIFPLNDRIAYVFDYITSYYNYRKNLHSAVEINKTFLEYLKNCYSSVPEEYIEVYSQTKENIKDISESYEKAQEKENQYCEEMRNDIKWKKLLHKISNDLWNETNWLDDILK